MTAAAPPLGSYQLRLTGFEGPLDILLRLIERHELDITAISLVAVTDQFLAHLDALENREPALLAEFVAIGARLLLLKTRGLFPQPPAISTADGEEDPEDLARQLREYRRYKEAARELGALERLGHRAFEPARLALETPSEYVVTLAPASPADLLRAVLDRLVKTPPVARVLQLVPRLSVSDMAARIAARLRMARAGLRFSDVLRDVSARGDVITAFLALLELVRRRRAEASQDSPYGEIVLRRAGALDGPPEPRDA